MTAQQMREKIAKVYKGPQWQRKVDCMDDSQVIAIYHSFLNKGKFDEPSGQSNIIPGTEKGYDERSFVPFIGEQLSIF